MAESRKLVYVAITRCNDILVLSSFATMALRVVKPEYITTEIATKIAVYNKTRDVMRKAAW